jgi:DNA (cytosine-5)-methyltransferase 1
MKPLSKLKVVDFFCGCGGLSLGFSMASFANRGFEIVAGLDFHKHAIASFGLNFPKASSLCDDIRKADFRALCAQIGPVDVVIGGPSCQGFSTHGKRLSEDPRNFLYKYFLKFIAELKPTWVLMENVTGLLRYEKGRFKDEILQDFRRLDYVVSFAQLQAADYGVPQIRKRVFFVANRLHVPFFFPNPTHQPDCPGQPENADLFRPARQSHLTVLDAIGDLPLIGLGSEPPETEIDYGLPPITNYQRWARSKSKRLGLHYGLEVPAENLARIRNIPPGGDWLDIPKELLPPRFARILKKDATTLYYRLRWDRPAYTITTVYRNVSSGAFTHPDEDRALTHREAARIQSFPDSFKFSESSVPLQIGNAVPPLLAKSIARAILVHQCVFEEKGFNNFMSFRSDVQRASSMTRCIAPGLKPATKLMLNHSFKVPSPPLTDNEWRRIKGEFKQIGIYTPSQVNLRGVINAIAFYLSNGRALNSIPPEYASYGTVYRWAYELSKREVIHKIFDVIACDVTSARHGRDAETVSSVGENVRRPTRRRPQVNPRHHFATVIYEVDQDKLSTLNT